MPALLNQPKIEIAETIGCPEFFADGATFVDRGDVMTGVYYVWRKVGETAVRIEVLRIHFSRTGWHQSLEQTLACLRERAVH